MLGVITSPFIVKTGRVSCIPGWRNFSGDLTASQEAFIYHFPIYGKLSEVAFPTAYSISQGAS
jgi:hypothetical protein